MSDRPGGEFRGPIQRSEWGWDRVADDRPRLPLIGIFLVLFGAVLLIGQLFPSARFAGSAVVVAVGLVLVGAWFTRRAGVIALYAGVVLTALSLPNLLRDLGLITQGNGWGTLFLGLGFIAIGLIRASGRAGVGWQIIVGGVLAALGLVQVLLRELPGSPGLDGLLWPLVILLAGVWLITRGRAGGGTGIRRR